MLGKKFGHVQLLQDGTREREWGIHETRRPHIDLYPNRLDG